MGQLLYKDISTPGIITDINTKDGVIEGYFSVFGNVDSDNDMIMPGAFTKTLTENGSRIRHIWQHDITQVLSRPQLSQDSKGLFFNSKISQTTLGKDTLLLYEDGVIDEHSFGYETIKKQRKGNYNELTELKVWEGSTVTLGANPFSQGGPAKGMIKEDVFKKMDLVLKAFRNGKYESDQVFEALELYFTQLKSYILDLTVKTTDAALEEKEAHQPEEVKDSDNDILIKQKLQSLTALFK